MSLACGTGIGPTSLTGSSAATRELFEEHGYEGTTLRAIARRADVALGTVALYAKDKRELIFMLLNLLIPPLIEKAGQSIDLKASLARSGYGSQTTNPMLNKG